MAEQASSKLGGAHVEITADTSQARTEIDKFGDDFKAKAEALRKELFGWFDDIKAKEAEASKGAAEVAPGIDPVKAAAAGYLIRKTAEDAFALGRELRAFYDSIYPDPKRLQEALGVVAGSASEQIRQATENIKALQKELLETTEIANFAENTLGIGNRQKTINDAILEEQKTLRRAIANDRQQQIQEDINAQVLAVADGAEKIEAERQKAIKRARDRYGKDAAEVVDAINRRYDVEEKRFEELEAKRKDAEEKRKAADEEAKQRHLDEIESRRRAYDDLIQHQKMKDREHAEALAKELGKALTGAFSEMTRSLELSKLVTTVSALNANMEKLTRQRYAQG